MLEKREFETNDFVWRLSTAVTVVSGFFSLIVFLLLLFNFLQIQKADPVDNLLITKMRQEYAAMPQKDEAFAQRIRDLELLNRKAFFTSQSFLRSGAIILFAGVSIFMVSAKYSIRSRRVKPKLDETPTAELEFLAYAESRQLIMWTGVGMLAVGLFASVMTQSALAKENKAYADAAAGKTGEGGAAPAGETKTASAAAAGTPSPDAPKWDVIEKNWPSFRGPGSGGIAHFTNAPTDWDIAAGKGVNWKVDVPMPGTNSPVIWEDRLYISGADEKTREVYCYDTKDGKQLWKQAVAGLPGSPATPPKVSEDTSFAAPSLAVHAGQVFAIFADGDLVSFDKDGKQLWGRNVGVPNNHYGHSSSLLAYDKFLYVQLDQKADSKLIALNVADGKQAWSVARKTISWASPVLAQTPFGPQLILNSEETVDAYDPLTGKQLWSQKCLGGEVAPSPAYSNGIVFAANEYAQATAIGIEKSDSGVAAKILWQFDELLPDVSSPVGDGERFYFGTASSTLVCLEAKTGKKLWTQEFTDGFYSSPVLVGDKVYIADKSGNMFIVQAGNEYKLIAQRALGEPAFATPAFMDGKMYVRTKSHLYCIGQANA